MRNDTRETTIKMTRTERGSPDGLVTNTYSEGKTYTLPSELASVFIDIKAAVKFKGKPEEQPTKVDPGGSTALLILEEGMLTRKQLAEDKLSNTELILYAETHLDVEKKSIPFTTKHTKLLTQVINIQEAWEEEQALKDE